MSTGTEHMTLTIRLIRSFEHRNIRFLVLKDVSPSCTVEKLKTRITELIHSGPDIPPPFKHYNYDTLKINSFAHGSKTSDTAITQNNDDEWILQNNDKSLEDYNIKNETELSFYYKEDYNKYKQNPQLLW